MMGQESDPYKITLERDESKAVSLAEHNASPFFSMGRVIVPPWCPQDQVPKVFPSLGAVMKGIGAVGKDSKNAQQGYKFRGIDAVYDMIHDLLAANDLITVPVVLERIETETKSSKSGTPQLHVKERVEYWFTSCLDGSQLIAGPIWAEALDNSDKATNKTMSFAQKYALLQCFTIPTSDVAEGDRETLPRESREQRQREPGEDDAGGDVIDKDTAAKVYIGFGELGVTKEMLEKKIGHQVAGLEVGWLETLRNWRDECAKNKNRIEALFGKSGSAERAENFNNKE